MTPQEHLELEAEEKYGKGTAIEMFRISGGWQGLVWSKDGLTIVRSAQGTDKADMIKNLRKVI